MKPMQRIEKVVVLGSGVMGSQIAAHCVNAGLTVHLLDLKSEDDARPNRIAEESLKKLVRMKPAPFADASRVSEIVPGNFEDDLRVIAGADWVCEVIVERLDIKQRMMKQRMMKSWRHE